MKKKNKPYYLKMYREWMEAGKLPDGYGGLCEIFGFGNEYLQLMEPTSDDNMNLLRFQDSLHYWGAETDIEFRNNLFGPLRQNIVLFLAAMNNEL